MLPITLIMDQVILSCIHLVIAILLVHQHTTVDYMETFGKIILDWGK